MLKMLKRRRALLAPSPQPNKKCKARQNKIKRLKVLNRLKRRSKARRTCKTKRRM